jgi:hypothetical protein
MRHALPMHPTSDVGNQWAIHRETPLWLHVADHGARMPRTALNLRRLL